jgi:hypothetical protein
MDSEDDNNKKALTSVVPPNIIDLEDDADDFGGGRYASFDAATESKFFYRKGEALAKQPWILIGMHKEIDRWGVGEDTKKIIERIFKEPGKSLPSVDELNSKVPVKDWPENPFGPPRGPYVLNYVITLANPITGEKIILSNSTAGQRSAYGDLKARIKNKQLMCGTNLIPLIELSVTSMPSNYGTKTIPYFHCYDWRKIGGDPVPAIAPVNPPDPLPGKSATTAELINDSIDDVSPPPASDLQPKNDKSKNGKPKVAKPFDDAIDDLKAWK